MNGHARSGIILPRRRYIARLGSPKKHQPRISPETLNTSDISLWGRGQTTKDLCLKLRGALQRSQAEILLFRRNL